MDEKQTRREELRREDNPTLVWITQTYMIFV